EAAGLEAHEAEGRHRDLLEWMGPCCSRAPAAAGRIRTYDHGRHAGPRVASPAMNRTTITRRAMHRLAAATVLGAAPILRDASAATTASSGGSPALAALAEAYYRGRAALFP